MNKNFKSEILEHLAVKIVSLVVRKVDNTGELPAYEGIEATREIRNMLIETFNQLQKDK